MPGIIQYAGLAPGLTGMYQINVQVPSSGLGLGDQVYVEFVTDFALVNQIQIPFGTALVKPAGMARPISRAPAVRRRGTESTVHRVPRGLAAGTLKSSLRRW